MIDSFKLWLLNRAEERHGLLREATRRRQCRQDLAQQIKENAETGKIAAIESGMDCDGSRYYGHRHLIPATVQAWDALRYRLAASCDGWFRLEIASPSEEIEHSSRDLALEAFEDGHPHHLTEGF
jgi:hypothetical protein